MSESLRSVLFTESDMLDVDNYRVLYCWLIMQLGRILDNGEHLQKDIYTQCITDCMSVKTLRFQVITLDVFLDQNIITVSNCHWLCFCWMCSHHENCAELSISAQHTPDLIHLKTLGRRASNEPSRRLRQVWLRPSPFTFKTQIRHYAKRALSVSRHEMPSLISFVSAS